VAGPHPDNGFLVYERVMLAQVRAAHPGAFRVTAVFIAELARQHQNFLAQWVLMPLEGRTGFVANYAGGMAPFGLFPCQRLALHARRRAGLPFLFAGMNNHSLGEIHIQHEKPRISAI